MDQKEKFTIILDANKPFIFPINGCFQDILYFADYNLYLQKIEKVYSVSSRLSKKLIWKEFIKDINRCDLKINEISYKNPTKVYNFLISKYPEDIVYRTLMLSTPDSLGLPCEILHKVFFNKNMYVVEPCNTKRYYKINIITTNKSIMFIFEKNMRIIDENGNSKYNVYIKVEFDILTDNQIFINYTIKKIK